MNKSELLIHKPIEMGVLDDVCRLCGEKTDAMTSSNVFAPGSSHVLSMIVQCMPITISKDDPYPKIVCLKCVNTLDAVHELRNKSLSVAVVFSQTLSSDDGGNCDADGNKLLRVIKEETFDIEFDEEPEFKFNIIESTGAEDEDRTLTGAMPIVCKEEDKSVLKKSHVTGGKRRSYQDKPFKCEFCPKKYCDKSSFKKHLLMHTSGEVFPCKDCEKTFQQRSSLISHQKTHDKKPFICQFCNKCYFDKSTLNKHLRIHTGEKPFQCQQCEKSFAVRAIMLIHQRTHFGVKNYECNDCGKLFSEKSYLKKHQGIHTGEKPFQCQECGKSFRLRATQISHQQIHTRKKFKIEETVSEEFHVEIQTGEMINQNANICANA